MSVKEITVGQRFIAESTEEKPTSGVHVGATLFEVDTSNAYFFDGEQWVLQSIKSKRLEWLNQPIEAGSHFGQVISCEGFDLITAFAYATGNVRLTFRVCDPSGDNYSWDALGTVNGVTQRVSSQAQITGMPKVKMTLVNEDSEEINANIFIYLGKIH
jgi:hypothetical protein